MLQKEYIGLDKFESFGKIPRYSRGVVITEKLDGTNAQIVITEDGKMLFGSRNRYITPEDDNFGFARWATEHKEDLYKLGVGRHYGEWYGQGIQRGYGLTEKRFALFNTGRWGSNPMKPLCCEVVPLLSVGAFTDTLINETLATLKEHGSFAAPFMDPEGIVIYHKASNGLFKKTIKDDESPKTELEVAA